MLKRLVKAVAEKHGLFATFMAKPYSQWTGCGMHVHVSLADAEGSNLFAGEDPERNELLLHALGGLKETMAESMLLFAPNANSYRRFRRNSYAPVSVSWGINNRTVSLRIPAGPAETCHIEHRPAGADANPYLVLASVLAGMHHGITQKIDPGPPVSGNGYEKEAKKIPTDWLSAIAAFRSSQSAQGHTSATGSWTASRPSRKLRPTASSPNRRRATSPGIFGRCDGDAAGPDDA